MSKTVTPNATLSAFAHEQALRGAGPRTIVRLIYEQFREYVPDSRVKLWLKERRGEGVPRRCPCGGIIHPAHPGEHRCGYTREGT